MGLTFIFLFSFFIMAEVPEDPCLGTGGAAAQVFGSVECGHEAMMMNQESCALNPNQPHCINGLGARDKLVVPENADNEADSKDEDSKEVRAPTPACQAGLDSTKSCSQIPVTIQSVTGAGNILGNYDMVSGALNSNIQKLNSFAQSCESLMNQCEVACTTKNLADSPLKSQCRQYSSQITRARAEAQKFVQLSVQTQEYAERIRTGESNIRSNETRIGGGQNLNNGPSQSALPVSSFQATSSATPVKKESSSGPTSDETVKGNDYSVDPIQKVENSEDDDEKKNALLQSMDPMKILGVSSVADSSEESSSSSEKKKKRPSKRSASSVKRKKVSGYFGLSGKKSSHLMNDSYQSGGNPFVRRQSSSSRRRGDKGPFSLASEEGSVYEKWEKERSLSSTNPMGYTLKKNSLFKTICNAYDDYEKKSGLDESFPNCPEN